MAASPHRAAFRIVHCVRSPGRRLDRIEAATGWWLEDAMDRFQATFALLARRLVTSDRTLGDVG
ncbi:hypothetical protein G3I59_45615 [Amycolatopsis rubida]|uniref:MarR family transcriptional regulator n=1 Tax=Amycolatopsis rubida TaxID=112413 RepID=A0ABX0C4T2_9PSEU|nr:MULTISPECIES: hypothetical protein [Amycolatopsis]MYW97700.1 hypothetical protein [Amycolatopsis rubida]NEC62686.1 hypothetical protein [Amycolatopsis rubida]